MAGARNASVDLLYLGCMEHYIRLRALLCYFASLLSACTSIFYLP